MKVVDHTAATPEENVALDEALLDAAEAGEGPPPDGAVLRLWESPRPIVVIGRSSRRAEEVDLDACRSDGVPVLRRSSGGAAIVAGPGCLMYAVVLSYRTWPQLRALDQAHRFVLERVLAAVSRVVPGGRIAGTSDLALDGRKFSGNSLRCKRDHLLYHGTLLLDFPLELVSRYLKTAPRQPEYRAGRDHRDFVANLKVSAESLRAALVDEWKAREPWTDWPRRRMEELVATRYSQESWHGDF